MISEILLVLWIFTPAMLANTAASLGRFIPKNKYLDMPLDFYKSWRGKRILGDGKTIKGFVIGTTCAILLSILQIHVEPFRDLSERIYPDYVTFNAIIWGFLAGFGALLGDSVESFFKRRAGIARGESWFPFDQIDYALGAIVLTSLYKPFPVIFYVKVVLVFFVIHLLSHVVWHISGLDRLYKKRSAQ